MQCSEITSVSARPLGTSKHCGGTQDLNDGVQRSASIPACSRVIQSSFLVARHLPSCVGIFSSEYSGAGRQRLPSYRKLRSISQILVTL